MRTEIPQREVDKESDVHDAEDWEIQITLSTFGKCSFSFFIGKADSLPELLARND